MKPNNHNINRDAVNKELEAISPMLANLGKPDVPMPSKAYFANLIDTVVQEAPVAQAPKRTFKLLPWSVASLAAAAAIAITVMLWPTNVATTNNSLAFDSLTNDELVQLAMQDDGLVEERLMEDDSLLVILADNSDFQYLDATNENDEYNKLLWEMVDDETLMEDWL